MRQGVRGAPKLPFKVYLAGVIGACMSSGGVIKGPSEGEASVEATGEGVFKLNEGEISKLKHLSS